MVLVVNNESKTKSEQMVESKIKRTRNNLLFKLKLYDLLFKLRYHNKYFFRLKCIFVDTDRLKEVDIETTTFCNRKCTFCPKYYDSSPQKEMSNELFYKILDYLEGISFKGWVQLSHYGEPLMDNRLLGFVKDIKSRLNVRIQFFTDGDMLTPAMAGEFLRNGVDKIYVSQHDSQPSRQIKELTNHNWGGRVLFSVVNMSSRALSNRCGSVKVDSLNPLYCSLNKMIIRADGTVPLCCNDYYNEVTFGNINDNTIVEIWKNELYGNVRRNLKHGKFNLDACKRCRGEK